MRTLPARLHGRGWIAGLLVGLWCVAGSGPVMAKQHKILVGSNHREGQGGLTWLSFEDTTGTLAPLPGHLNVPNPSFLALHPAGHTVYACNENGVPLAAGGTGSALSAYALTEGGASLRNSVELAGGPCHVSVDQSGKYLAAATYGAGTLAVYTLRPDGAIQEQVTFVKHSGKSIVPGRQGSPHAHAATFAPDGKHLLVADLGLDKTLSYPVDAASGKVAPEPKGSLDAIPGSGPRHLAFGADGRFVYVANELSNTVTVFRYQSEDGGGQAVQTLSTLPAEFTGRSSVAEIALHPNGNWLYVSNRGYDSIAVYRVNQASGLLETAGVVPTIAKSPRHFTLSPDGKWLLVAGQDNATVEVFRLDAETGTLTAASRLEGLVGKPVCLSFLP